MSRTTTIASIALSIRRTRAVGSITPPAGQYRGMKGGRRSIMVQMIDSISENDPGCTAPVRSTHNVTESLERRGRVGGISSCDCLPLRTAVIAEVESVVVCRIHGSKCRSVRPR